MFYMFREDYLSPYCLWKDKIDLKFFTKCGVSDLSLEDYPIVLEKIMIDKKVNLLSSVPKHEVINSRNLHAITKQGTKIGGDNMSINQL